MKNYLFYLLLICGFKVNAQQFNIIPKPSKIEYVKGVLNFVTKKPTFSFTLPKSSCLFADFQEDSVTRNYIVQSLIDNFNFAKNLLSPKSKLIFDITIENTFTDSEDESYLIRITTKDILLKGNKKGLINACHTLLQIFDQFPDGKIPCATITDKPRFAYRGMHLDVGRHFQPVSYIKKYIDYLARYKYNTFHWHLTEDQGWRIEIKKYPKLTSVGGYRNGTITGRYPGTGNTNEKYGGFYTQAQIKEIVQYATERNITVIPEIELPGHSSAAIAAYPELSCFPSEPTKIPNEHVSTASKNSSGKLVQETWGVFEDVFCPTEYTFNFLQDVMDEVIALFPSQYIHIGGDECPKESWKRSAFCQQFIKDNNLKDEHGLQSYFIQRIEKYLNSKGRNIIGWDEILEGGLAPNATLMSWRGEAGGIEAAKQNHNVIMTPGSHCYFDHSQSRDEDSVTIGGYTTVEKVYSYNPVPKELNATQANYVLGAQGNVWTEYMSNPRKIEYMIFPRMIALSEVLWSDTMGRNWEEFEPRLVKEMDKLAKEGATVSRAYFKPAIEIKKSHSLGSLALRFNSKLKCEYCSIYVTQEVDTPRIDCGNKTFQIPDKVKDPIGQLSVFKDTIFYLCDTSNIIYRSNRYATPMELLVKESSTIKYKQAYHHSFDQEYKINFSFNKATAQKITLAMPPSNRYPGNDGTFGLINGVKSERGISSTEWLGFGEGQDCEATIDFGKTQDISKVGIHTIDQQGSWIYAPSAVEIYVSNDGANFQLIKTTLSIKDDKLLMKNFESSFEKTSCRFVRIHIKNYGQIPSGKQGAGHQAWLFVDEISVD